MMVFRRGLLSCVPALLAHRCLAQSPPVQIYAAMTFRPALERVLATYRQAGGSAIAVYAPTPVLIRQLAGGAPADILLTADPAWMDEAARLALVRPESRTNLLMNDLVLAGPPSTPVGGTITPRFPLDALLGGGRLAMCDPEHDPAGRYARQSLQSLGFWPLVEPRIAIAESAPAAVVLVDHHEAAAAVCFKTDLHGDSQAVLVGTFPPDSHSPIIYPVALARDTQNDRAVEVLTFLHSAESLATFIEFGYSPAT